jgi:hypothetical protein
MEYNARLIGEASFIVGNTQTGVDLCRVEMLPVLYQKISGSDYAKFVNSFVKMVNELYEKAENNV